MANNLNTRVVLHAAQLKCAHLVESIIADIEKEKRISPQNTAFVTQQLIDFIADLTVSVERQSHKLEAMPNVF